MKKLLALLLIGIFLSSNISFANLPYDPCELDPTAEGCELSEIINEKPQNPQDQNPTSVMGITCTEEMLRLGQCKLNVYDTLGIRKTVRNEGDPTSVGLFVQDIVLSATFFIGTVVTIALIVS